MYFICVDQKKPKKLTTQIYVVFVHDTSKDVSECWLQSLVSHIGTKKPYLMWFENDQISTISSNKLVTLIEIESKGRLTDENENIIPLFQAPMK